MKSLILLAVLSVSAFSSEFIGPLRDHRQTNGLGHVEYHGALRAVNGRIVNQYGMITKSDGMALFWSQWAGDFWNADVINWLVSDWKIKIVRCSMGVNQGGYIDNMGGEKDKLTRVVDAAIGQSIYAIIDWHIEGENMEFKQQAKDFFDEMSKKYGQNDHVLYEGWNEPTNQSWSGELKGYHQEVVGVIRAHSQNLYIAGNPTWSSRPDQACDDRLDVPNVAYTFHFYAASHKQDHRDAANSAISRGCAVFVTEWGTCEASGNGYVDEGETNTYFQWAEQQQISLCNWSVNDKAESCSALNPGASHNGGWSDGDLTQSGRIVKGHLTGNKPAPGPGPSPSGGCCSWNNDCRHDEHAGDWCDQSQQNCEQCGNGAHWIPK